MTDIEGATTVRPLSIAQRQAGRFLAQCQAEAVQVTVFGDAVIDELIAWRADTAPPAVTLTHLLIAALVRALERHPDLNAHYRNGGLVRHDDVHLGLAVTVPGGDLLTPVMRRLRGCSLERIAALTDRQARKARDGDLTLEDIRGASFTLSNVGQSRIARYATPVVPLPQVAILATMAVRQVPTVRGGAITAAHTLPLSLSFDHRAVNGAEATAFLETYARILERPDALAGTGNPQEKAR